MHHFQSRWMNGVAAEVAQKVAVLATQLPDSFWNLNALGLRRQQLAEGPRKHRYGS